MRLWLAEQVAHQVDAVGLAGAPWVVFYARALGARIGNDVDLHTLPPVTGLLRIGDGAAIEPEVDLAGYWIDGDTVRIGGIRIGDHATVGARSTLAPGTRIDPGAEVAPGSAVFGRVKSGQLWAGSPAVRAAEPSKGWPEDRPLNSRRWVVAYGAASIVLGSVADRRLRPRRAGRRTRDARSARRGERRPACPAPASCPGCSSPAQPSPAPSSSPPGCSRSGSFPAPTRCAAGSAGRRGAPSGCSTRPAPCCSRCTRA